MLSLISRRASSVAPRASTSTSTRSISSVTSLNHPATCMCARCSSSPVTWPPRPSRPSAPSASRAFSSLSARPTVHPNAHAHSHSHGPNCGCLSHSAPSAVQSVGAERGMKVRSAVKKYCEGCSIVKRKGTVFVICSKEPKHKQVTQTPLSSFTPTFLLMLFCLSPSQRQG